MSETAVRSQHRPPTQAASTDRGGRPNTGNVKTWKRTNGDTGFAIRFTDQYGERQHERCGLESEGWNSPALTDTARLAGASRERMVFVDAKNSSRIPAGVPL